MSPCRVLVRGKMNTCLVEFEDGYRVITSRNYLIKFDTLQKRLAKRSSSVRNQAFEKHSGTRDKF